MDEQHTYPFLPDDKCLTEQQLFDYIDGKLSGPEMHRAEKHLLDCNMCSDALEGFEKIKHRDKVAAFIPEKISEKKNPEIIREEASREHEPKVIPIRSNRRSLYAIAAAIVLILGITVVMKMSLSDNTPESKQLADNNTDANHAVISDGEKKNSNSMVMDSASTDLAVTKDESKNKMDGPIAVSPDGDANFKNPAKPTPDHEDAKAVNLRDVADQPNDRAESESIQPTIAATDKSSDVGFIAGRLDDEAKDTVSTYYDNRVENADKEVVAKNNSAKKSSYRNNKDTDANAGVTQSPPASVNAGVPSQQNGANTNTTVNEDVQTTSSNTTDTSRVAVTKMSSVGSAGNVGNDVPTEEAISLSYDRGVQLLSSGQASASLPYFEEVLQNPNHPNYQDAQWQKSLALIQLNRINEAKKLLNEIVKKNGKYKKDAQDKLKTL